MKHYRINKVAAPGGKILKSKDILAQTDRQAVDRARDDNDCPICEVRQAGEMIGTIHD